jgi:NAD(P)-dependent dehydrogenase (short-subunit alcohol dehydrogenase family)
MLTFTVARDYAKSGVYVNAVDPGWINLQHAAPQARTMTDAGFVAPFDVTDAAARVLDPVYTAVNGGPCAGGKFFKDYQAVDW